MARPKPPVRLESYPIEYLGPNPFQPRHQIDPAELSDLVASIKQFGFSGFLEARIDPDDPGKQLQIVYGHRRLAAAKLAGLSKLLVAVVERTDREMADQAFIENRTHKQLTPWEEACFLRDYQQRHGSSIRAMERDLYISKGFIQNRFELLRIPQDSPVLPALTANKIDMETAKTLNQLAPTMPEPELAKLVNQVLTGTLANTDLKRRVRRARSTVSTSRTPVAASQRRVPVASAGERDTKLPELRPASSVGRCADLVLDKEVRPMPPLPGLTGMPCGRSDDEERMDSGMFQPDGTELEDAPAGTQAAYLCVHALRHLLPQAEQHLAAADWDSLSPMANDELDELLDRLEELLADIRAAR